MAILEAQVAKLDNGEVVRLPGIKITGGSAKPNIVNKATTAPVPDEWDRDMITPWGTDNRSPTKVRELVDCVPLAGQAIDKWARQMYGNGLYYYKESDVQDGDNTVQRHYDQKIENWLRTNRIRTDWFARQCKDYLLYYNTFSELIFSKNRQTITNMYHKSAEHCRLSEYDKFGRINFLYYSPYFETTGYPEKRHMVKMRLFQWDKEEDFLKTQRSRKFAWHTKGPDGNGINYAKPPHSGLYRENGWIEVSKAVPEIVATMQKNQISIRYIIRVDEEWFEFRHSNWRYLEEEKRTKLFDELCQSIQDELAGTENAGKALSTIVRRNDMTGEQVGLIHIEAVDDKAKTGTWVPDSEKSDAQIVMGFGWHPSQFGLQSEQLRGGGSDQRESYNTGVTLNSLAQEIILEPLNWVSRYNKWGVKFIISRTAHTPLNVDKSAEVSDGLNPAETL